MLQVFLLKPELLSDTARLYFDVFKQLFDEIEQYWEAIRKTTSINKFCWLTWGEALPISVSFPTLSRIK
jgi:hypothetical protein